MATAACALCENEEKDAVQDDKNVVQDDNNESKMTKVTKMSKMTIKPSQMEV